MKNNIVCFWWGTWGDDYGVKYVNKLYNDLQKHTTLDYNFYCFTDKPEKLDVPTIKFKPKFLWNLNKFEAYNPEHGLEGKIFTFDLTHYYWIILMTFLVLMTNLLLQKIFTI